MMFTKELINKDFLSFATIQFKKTLVYTIVFTQIYNPAAYGGKLYFEIEEKPGNKVVKRINLRIFDENEEKDSQTFVKREIYNNIIKFNTFGSNLQCEIPPIKPDFKKPTYGRPLHSYFEHSGPNLKINHYDVTKNEEINFTVAHDGCIRIENLLSPQQVVSIKTFGNIFVNTNTTLSAQSLRLAGHNIQTDSPLLAEKKLKLIAANDLVNNSSLVSQGKLRVTAASKVINHRQIEGRDKETSITTHDFINHGLINAHQSPLTLKVNTGENHNIIFGQGGIDLTIGALFTNHKITEEEKGLLESWDTFSIKGTGALKNYGFLKSRNDTDIQTDLENYGIIKANTDFVSETEGKTLTNALSGKILAERNIKIKNTKLLVNEGSIQAQQPSTNASTQTMPTRTDQTADAEWVTTATTSASTTNSASSACTNENASQTTTGHATFHIKTGKNTGILSGEDRVALTIEELFENEGKMISPKNVDIQGQGSLRNTDKGLIKADKQLQFVGISVTNEGLLQSFEQFSADLPLLVHKGDINAPHATLIIKDLQNFHNILIYENLILNLNKGFNEGEIKSKNCALTIHELFTNKQDVHTERSFISTGAGTFENKHNLFSDDSMALNNNTFNNQGNVNGIGSVTLSGAITNAPHAKILSDTHIEVTEKATVSNLGTIYSEKTFTFSPVHYQNRGRTEAKGNMNFPNCLTLENVEGCHLRSETGTVSLPQVTSFFNDGIFLSHGTMMLNHLLSFRNRGNLQSREMLIFNSSERMTNEKHLSGNLGVVVNSKKAFLNQGDVISKGPISIEAPQIDNTKTIHGHKDVTLTAPHAFTNAEGAQINSEEGKTKIVAPQLQAKGPIRGHQIEIQSQSLEGSVEAVDTLTLYLPQGWSLGNKAQEFGHNIILHGPIRNPGPLNIKGNFTWHNPEGLSNNFDIIVGGQLNLNMAGPWINLQRVQAHSGANITTYHFMNKGLFYGNNSTHFNCSNGFENCKEVVIVGNGQITAYEGHFINHPSAEFQQFGSQNNITINAAQTIQNMGGTIRFEGRVQSNSSAFSNEVGPDGALVHGRNSQGLPYTQETPGVPASFHAGQAIIKAGTLLNRGARLYADQLFQFEGNKLANLTCDYWYRGTKVEEHKKNSKSFAGIKYKKGKTTHENVPDSKVISRRQALLTSKGTMNLTVSGRTYNNTNAESLNVRNKQFHKRRFGRRGRAQGPIQNTGTILAGSTNISVPSTAGFTLTPINQKKISIPPCIYLEAYFDETTLNGPSLWVLDKERKTGAEVVASIPIPFPSQESINEQMPNDSAARKAAEDKAVAFFKTWLTKQFEAEWDSRHKGTRTHKDLARKTAELKKLLQQASGISILWEPDVEELTPMTPEYLSNTSARISVLADSRLKGGERMRFDPHLLAHLVTKAFTNTIGFASVSKRIHSATLLSRVLEEEGYLNARRVHGLPTQATPSNWNQMSPQEQLVSQLREIILFSDIDKFKDPTIVYQPIESHGELVLSPLTTFPPALREGFESMLGSGFATDYFSLTTTQGNLNAENLAARKGVAVKSAANLKTHNVFSQGDISSETKGDAHHSGHLSSQEGNVNSTAEGFMHVGAAPVASTVGSSHKHRVHTTTHPRTYVTAGKGKDINLRSGKKGMLLEGLDLAAGRKIHVKTEGSLHNKAVYDTTITEHTKKSRKGGGKSKTVRQQTSQVAIPNTAKTEEGNILFESEGDNIQEAPEMESGGSTTLVSHQAKLVFKAVISTHQENVQKEKNSLVWKKQQIKGSRTQKAQMSKFNARRGLHFSAAQGIEVEFTGSLDELEKNPSTAWVKQLRNDPKVNWHRVEEEHKKWNHKAQGLTPAGAALISLAVGIATGGAGAAIAAGVSQAVGTAVGSLLVGEVAGTMASAAFATLASQASITLVNNQGNIGKTLKQLGSSEQVRALAIAVAAAGLTYGISDQLGISQPPQTTSAVQMTQAQVKQALNDRLLTTATQTGVSNALAVVSGDQDVRQAVQQGVRGIAASTLGGYASNQIGGAYSSGAIDFLTHKLLHGLSGAAQGAIFSKDPLSGAAAGATGAVVAETVAMNLPSSLSLRTRADAGRVAAGVVSLLANQDVNTGITVATTAVENNLLNSEKPKRRDEGNSQVEDEASEPLNLRDVNMLQLMRENSKEDFIDIMVKLERPDSPPSPRIKYKYEKRYEMIRLSDFRAFNPGQDRFESLASLSLEELRVERLFERDPSGKLSPRSRQKMEQIIMNEYNYLQGQKVSLAIGAIAGIASLRSVGRSPLPQSTPRSANANVAPSSSSTTTTVPSRSHTPPSSTTVAANRQWTISTTSSNTPSVVPKQGTANSTVGQAISRFEIATENLINKGKERVGFASRLAPIPEEISVFTKQKPTHLSRNLEGLDLKILPIQHGQVKKIEKAPSVTSGKVRYTTTTTSNSSQIPPSSTIVEANQGWTTSTSTSSANSGFYNPREVRNTLETRYPKQVTSTTVPESSAKNVKLAGQRHPETGIVFDSRGYPIFDPVVKFDTRISREVAFTGTERQHMSLATKNIKIEIQEGKINPSVFDEIQLKAIKEEKERIPGYTWHHHQDIGRMQLIPKEIHNLTGHVGGVKTWSTQ